MQRVVPHLEHISWERLASVTGSASCVVSAASVPMLEAAATVMFWLEMWVAPVSMDEATKSLMPAIFSILKVERKLSINT